MSHEQLGRIFPICAQKNTMANKNTYLKKFVGVIRSLEADDNRDPISVKRVKLLDILFPVWLSLENKKVVIALLDIADTVIGNDIGKGSISKSKGTGYTYLLPDFDKNKTDLEDLLKKTQEAWIPNKVRQKIKCAINDLDSAWSAYNIRVTFYKNASNIFAGNFKYLVKEFGQDKAKKIVEALLSDLRKSQFPIQSSADGCFERARTTTKRNKGFIIPEYE
jgi:hypothetical protein